MQVIKRERAFPGPSFFMRFFKHREIPAGFPIYIKAAAEKQERRVVFCAGIR